MIDLLGYVFSIVALLFAIILPIFVVTILFIVIFLFIRDIYRGDI